MKGLNFSNFLPLTATKSYYWNVLFYLSAIISENKLLDIPVFNNERRLNHSSPMNNAVTDKMNHFPLGPQLALNQNSITFF